MSVTTIQQVLETNLSAVTNLPPLQKENERYTPLSGTPWCRSTLLPAETVRETIGTTGRVRYRGLYQVDVFYPADQGATAASTMADAIVDEFWSGTQLVHQQSNLTVHIEMAWREAGSRYEQFYSVPVLVRWRAIE